MHLGKVAVRKTVSALGLLGHGLVYSEVPLGVFVPTALGYEGVLLGRVGLVLAPCISFVVDELSSLNTLFSKLQCVFVQSYWHGLLTCSIATLRCMRGLHNCSSAQCKFAKP